MKVNRLLVNLCTSNLEASKTFYTNLFDFNVDYDSDWFVHLISKGSELEIGLILESHDLVPEAYRGYSKGMYITLVVDDATAIFEKAKLQKYEIIQSPELTFYGQRRVLIKDPSGVLVDVSSPE